MSNEVNQYQIIRKDARNCFVESLRDAFEIGKAHFVFATYDLSKPVGERQTNKISIYISIDELLELHRKLICGELRYILQNKKRAEIRPRCFKVWAERLRNSLRSMDSREATERVYPVLSN